MNLVKLSDLLSGKKVWKNYTLLNKTQWYSKNEMELYQVNKLKKLLHHCYNNVPFYKRIIDERNIDIENFSSTRILKEFPILTKEIIQDNYKDFIPKNNKTIAGVKESQTGGTTGNILVKRNDANTRSVVWGTYLRFEHWMRLLPRDKRLVLMGGHVKKEGLKHSIISFINRRLKNTVNVDIYDTSEETLDKVIALLTETKFGLIRAYPQFLFLVAKRIEELGLSFRVKAISTTAEPIMDEHRALFRKVFNAEVFDQFGCGEIGGIAYECNKHNGLHIAEERVIVETTPDDDLLLTDLDNFAMPFIRYWNADQAIISDNECSCGRKSKLITRIMGRTCDYLIGQNGEFLHWAYFWHLIFDSNIAEARNLKKFQIVQQSKAEILIKLVSDKLSEDESEFIIKDVKRRLGDINVFIVYVEFIENTETGKYRPVINLII